jgi:hypothetical protein
MPEEQNPEESYYELRNGKDSKKIVVKITNGTLEVIVGGLKSTKITEEEAIGLKKDDEWWKLQQVY